MNVIKNHILPVYNNPKTKSTVQNGADISKKDKV